MSKRLLNIVFVILLLAVVGPIRGQYKTIYNLNVSDGLSQNTINAIYQDERDYIWFGTRNGLNLYNGNTFTVYKKQKDNTNTLLNSATKQILGDKKGHIFVRTADGAVLKASLSSANYTILIPSKVTTICYADDKLYCALSHRIVGFKDKTEEEIFSFEDDKNVITSLSVINDKLYIGTMRNGLYSLNCNGMLEHIIHDGYVTTIMCDSFGEIWVGFQENSGLVRIVGETKQVYKYSATDSHTINSNTVQTCCEDHNGNIWIGTFNGLSYFDRKTETISRLENHDLANSSIISLMTDHQGTIWAGTYYLGVSYFNPEDQIYEVIHASSEDHSGLNSEVVGDMIEDKSGNIWIATADGGVNCYLQKNHKFVYYTIDDGLLSNNIKSIYLDEVLNKLWIATHKGGLSSLDLKTHRIKNYVHDEANPKSLPSNVVRDITPYGDKLLLAVNGGVVLFNKQTGCCENFFNHVDYRRATNYSSQLLIDSRNNLWIVHTSNGVYRYNLQTRQMDTFQNATIKEGGISPGRVNYMYEDPQGRIWLCNNQNGLDMYSYKTETFTNYDMRNSHLSSNTLYAVAQFSPDSLIITSDAGYSILSTKQKTSVNFLNNKTNPLIAANESSLLVASDGRVYIGGMNGLLAFDKDKINVSRKDFDIKPFRLAIDGEIVHVHDDNKILTNDFSQQQKIVIGPHINSFSIEYAITNYLPYGNNDFYYRLHGLADKWNRLEQNNKINFTNLPYGKYVLQLSNSDMGEPDAKEHNLQIIVKPPFYRTTIAYIFYIIAILISLYYIKRSYKNRIRLQEAVKYEKKHNQEIEELNKYKLRFFTNISHEFRTPLSVIIAQMEFMMDKYHDDMSIYSPLNRIYRCCVQLKYLVSELLDFRKQEQGYMKLKVRNLDMAEFVHDQFLNFQTYAKQKSIQYIFIKSSEKISAWFDPKQMQKVINNLIFNAFKHVDSRGKISVAVSHNKSEIWIDIVNTGEGIRPEHIDKIFNRFYQIDVKDSVEAGTGIGLALSKEIVTMHKGQIQVFSEQGRDTTFRVIIKTGNSHFDTSDICDEQQELITREDNSALCTAGLEYEEMQIENSLTESKNGTVLIIEDDLPLQHTLFQIFEPFYNVILALNGEDGLKKLSDNSVDLVISDITMPVMDGLEFCRRVKSDSSHSHIPVVLLTARADDCQKLEGLKYGADDYILKPFSSRELVSRCNNIVNNRRLLQKKFSQKNKTEEANGFVASNYQDLEFVNRAREIVLSHLSEKSFHLEDLAKEMGVSRTKLFTRLRSIVNQTPMEFIFEVHLIESSRMLREDMNLNISEVSEKAGFSSPKIFRRLFKEKYGMSPLEYRKSL